MKNSELVKLLNKYGCRFIRHGSKHDMWITKDGIQFYIPRHKKELPKGTAEAIMKEAGVKNV